MMCVECLIEQMYQWTSKSGIVTTNITIDFKELTFVMCIGIIGSSTNPYHIILKSIYFDGSINNID